MKNIIDLEFKKPGNEPDGLIKISLGNDSIPSKNIPIRFMVYNIANKVVWSTELYPNMFSFYYEIPYKRIEAITADGNRLFKWDWNTFEHGDICHQLFYLWALDNRGAKGIAVGAHDGTCGEWVGPVGEGLLNAVLVEPSDKQLLILKQIYDNNPWVKIEQTLVTTDGADVIFYEGAEGQTNSVNKEHVLKYTKDVTEVNMRSVTVNHLIEKHGIGGGWWLHVDAEGLDDKIIMSLDDDNLPSCIIFEHEQFDEDRLREIQRWTDERSYTTNKSFRNTICIK
jgi:hypothetical protein